MRKITRVAIYICDRCKEEIAIPQEGEITTGYGQTIDGDKHCFSCCGELDNAAMIADGEITLYLVSRPNPHYRDVGMMNRHKEDWFVANWPDSLRFKVLGGPHKGRHNIARYRYDVWFVGGDGHLWHGVQYGDNTQIVHCKRTKTIYADYIKKGRK